MFTWDQDGSPLNNKRAFSLVETMLALAIFCMIFLTLLPMTNELYQQMEQRKMSYHAMTVNYEGVILHNSEKKRMSGMKNIDGIRYDWIITNDKICSSYKRFNEKRNRCVKLE